MTRLFWLGLLLTLIVGCKRDNDVAPPLPETIKLDVSMPADIRIQGIEGSFAHYWQVDDQLQLLVEDPKGSIHKLEVVGEPVLAGDGKRATVEVKIPSTLRGTAELYIFGGVTNSTLNNQRTVETKGALQTSLDGWSETLPYDIRKTEVRPPLSIPKSKLSQAIQTQKLALEAPGVYRCVSVYNESTQDQKDLQELQLVSETPWLPSDNGFNYNLQTRKFSHSATETSLTLTALPKSLAGGTSTSLLLWIAEPQEGVTIRAKRGDSLSESGNSDFLTEGKGDFIALELGNETGIVVTHEFKDNKPANDSKGGDPYFDFSDIKYWVGSGSNRVAFVMDYHDAQHPYAFVWGYRYDGEKTAGDMIEEICNTDPRLFTVIGSAMGGYTCIFSFAYLTAPMSGSFDVFNKGKSVPKKSDGVFEVDFDPRGEDNAVDHLTHNASSVLWHTGFYEIGYWSYFYKFGRLVAWGYASAVPHLMPLADGTWHGVSWCLLNNGSMSGEPFSDRFVAVEPPKK